MSVSHGRRKVEEVNSAVAAHEASIARVATWKNTVQSNRRARLEATKVKKELAEQNRIQQDNEWHLILEDEKKHFLENAQQTQLFQTPEVRALHEKLNTIRVNEERSLQTQLHQMRSEYQKQQDNLYHENMLSQLQIAQIQEQEKIRMKAEEARINALLQQVQIKEKHSKVDKEHTVMDKLKAAQDLLLVDHHLQETAMVAQKQKQRIDFTAGLDNAVQQHAVVIKKAKEAQQQFLEGAEKHRNFVDSCQNKIKQVKQSDIDKREQYTAQVRGPTEMIIKQSEANTQQFLNKWAQATSIHDYNEKEASLQSSFKQHRDNNMESVTQQVQAHIQEKKIEKDSVMQFVQERSKTLAKAQLASEEKLHQQEIAAKALAADHLQRASLRRAELSKQKEAEDAQHASHLAAQQRGQDDYLRYAESLVSSEERSGHDTSLLVDVISSHQREGQCGRHRGVGPVEVATWDRIFGSDPSPGRNATTAIRG